VAFSDRLRQAILSADSVVVAGLDPTPAVLPPTFDAIDRNNNDLLAGAYADFCLGLIDIARGRVAAVKPNIAFFEALGIPGLSAYARICAAAHQAGLLVIGDVKRGDIGSTAAAYAEGLLGDGLDTARPGRLGPHDALTLNPFLGTDSVGPFLERARLSGSGVFILVRTSNPSAKELQELPLASGGTVADAVARMVTSWAGTGDGYSDVGAVVGATSATELVRLRGLLPRSWLLVPGYGAQGGSADDVAGAFDADGLGAIVNASRSIMAAWKAEKTNDWQSAAIRAISDMNTQLNAVRGKPRG
jgi:orotidine-5'-phosphate decarboxylase